MQLNVKVIPRAKQNKIDIDSGGVYRVHTTVVPENGKANNEVIKMLAKYLKIPKTQIKIVRGETSHNKVIEF